MMMCKFFSNYILYIMSNSWMDTVKKTFRTNRKTNKAYQFKDALKDAKKIYKKGTGNAMMNTKLEISGKKKTRKSRTMKKRK